MRSCTWCHAPHELFHMPASKGSSHRHGSSLGAASAPTHPGPPRPATHQREARLPQDGQQHVACGRGGGPGGGRGVGLLSTPENKTCPPHTLLACTPTPTPTPTHPGPGRCRWAAPRPPPPPPCCPCAAPAAGPGSRAGRRAAPATWGMGGAGAREGAAVGSLREWGWRQALQGSVLGLWRRPRARVRASHKWADSKCDSSTPKPSFCPSSYGCLRCSGNSQQGIPLPHPTHPYRP